MTEDFETLTRRLRDAVQRQDRAALEELVAEEFMLITSRAGNPAGRADWIAAATGAYRVSSYSLRDVRVVEAGPVAVVVCRSTQDATMGGEPAARDWLTTDVWTNHSGQWRIVARHAEVVSD